MVSEAVMKLILRILEIAAPILIAIVISLALRKYFSKLIKKHIVKDHKGKETVFRLLQRAIITFIFIIAIFISISRVYPGIGAFLSSALLAAGFLAIIVGLAAQRTLGNIFAGFNIVLTKPIRIGDVVVIRNEYGTVEDITLRHTIIRIWDNRRMIIPNSVLDEELIVNYSIRDPKKLFGIVVYVPHNTDIEKVGYIMTSEAKNHPDVLKELDPIFQLLEFEANSLKLRLLFLAKDQGTAFTAAVALRRSIWNQLKKEKIKFSMPSIQVNQEIASK